MGIRGTRSTKLNEARLYLRMAQEILENWRGVSGAPRWLVAQAEQRVLAALDMVWREQCRAVFEDRDDGFFETDKCRRFVNNVDWDASYGIGAGPPFLVVHLKSPIPEMIP